MPVLAFTTDVGFIDFDKADKLLELGIAQGETDLVAHQKGCVVRTETHDSVDLQGADAFLAGQHHVHDAEPVSQWLVGVLEDRPDQNGEAITSARSAGIAVPVVFFGAVCMDVVIAAARAAHAFGPAVRLKIEAASRFVRELGVKLLDRHLMDAQVFGFGRFHGYSPECVAIGP